VFCVRNALKLAYEHLRFEKVFRELYLRTPLNGDGKEVWRKGGGGRGGEGGKGRGRKGEVPLA
jgi:hypothetical protein